MPRATFTGNLQRHVACPPSTVPGSTVQETLEAAFALYPKARGYVLDKHRALRAYMVVFVDGPVISDRRGLTDSVVEEGGVFVMQALSGG